MTPKGELTESQLELMNAVWCAGGTGATVAEIWEAISAERSVARTTVLTLLGRLEERGWLRRKPGARAIRYVAATPRAQAVSRLSRRFVDLFFGGSPSELLKSLLGSEAIEPNELARLRRLVNDGARNSRPHKSDA